MMRGFLYLAASAIFLAGCVTVHETKHITEDKPAAVSNTKEPARVLRYVVLFKFKEGTTDAQIRQIESDFCALPSKVDAIHDFEWGTDVSVENLQQGFTHCFIVTFHGEADRDRYLRHPAHEEFGTILAEHLDKVLVVDYWTKQ